MEIAKNWKDYEILDMADGEKLEVWKNVTLIRPDPQIIWKQKTNPALWNTADARYNRSNQGGGRLESFKEDSRKLANSL